MVAGKQRLIDSSLASFEQWTDKLETIGSIAIGNNLFGAELVR